MTVYSALLHHYAGDGKAEKERIMPADEVISRIRNICTCEISVSPFELMSGENHANVELLTRLCHKLTDYQYMKRATPSLRKSLIPKRQSSLTSSRRQRPSPNSSPSSSVSTSSGKPPFSPMTRKTPVVSVSPRLHTSVSSVRIPRSSGSVNPETASVDSMDTLAKPLRRWPEMLQITSRTSAPHLKTLAQPRELGYKPPSFLAKTKSQQELLNPKSPAETVEPTTPAPSKIPIMKLSKTRSMYQLGSTPPQSSQVSTSSPTNSHQSSPATTSPSSPRSSLISSLASPPVGLSKTQSMFNFTPNSTQREKKFMF